MHLDDYQQKASGTAIYADAIRELLEPIREEHGELYEQLTLLLRISYTALGLAGEAGEFANKVKKLIRDHDGLLLDSSLDSLAEELGGNLWYNSQSAREIGRNLDGIGRRNLEILADRAERGKIQGSGDNR